MPRRHPELPLDPDAPVPPRPLHAQGGAIALVFVGGAIGTLARYGIAVALPTAAGGWPWATFTANLAGAFVLGMLLEALARRGDDTGVRQRLRLLLGTGFCGGFTTYSTFAVEADLLVRGDHAGLAVGYLLASLAGGLVLTTLGVAAAAGTHPRQP